MKSPPKPRRSQEKHSISPKIKKIIENLDEEYYQSAPQTTKNNAEFSHELEKEIHMKE